MSEFWEVGEMYAYTQKHISGTYSKRLKAYRNITENHNVEKVVFEVDQLFRSEIRVKFRDGKYNFMLLELDVPFAGREALYTKFLYVERFIWVPDVDNYVSQMMKL